MVRHFSLTKLTTFTLCGLLAGPIIAYTPASFAQAQRQSLTQQQKDTIINRAEEIVKLANQDKYQQVLQYLASAVKEYVTADRVKGLWESEVLSNAGDFKEIAGAKVVDVINADIVSLTLKFANGSKDVQFIFNKQQELVGISLPSSLSVDEVAEGFVENLAKGNYGEARAVLNPLLKTEIFADKLEQEWQEEIKQYGKFKRVVDVKVKPSNTLGSPDLAIVTIAFDKETRDYFLFLDGDRKIVNIDFVDD